MEVRDQKKYLEAYYNNEYDANRQMTFALLFSALLLSLIWVGYITGFFALTHQAKTLVTLFLPILVGILIVPVTLVKTKAIKNKHFKYAVLFDLMLVIATLNVIIPKHAIIGWAICIVLSNHYYNPKVGLTVFLFTVFLMLGCIYLGMFLGEFDPNLLTGQVNDADNTICHFMLTETFPNTPEGRLEFLRALKGIGSNRYLSVFIYYYLSRLVNITIIFYISNALNKRTRKLLIDEIKVNSEQERTSAELDVAKEIQLQTLPREFVTNKDIEIQAELKAARTVGGDFYDYFTLDDDNVAIVIGDVSGKGIGAAMFMMKSITCFKNTVSINKTPEETLETINKQLVIGNESNMFVTCFYAMINIRTGLVRYANAGHTKPIYGKKKNYKYLDCQSGFVLGGLEDAFVSSGEFYLKKGETITLYTDGITEAKSITGELYGNDRLLNLFNKKEYSCLLELHADLKDDLLEFSNGEEQSDDITYITLKYHGDEYAYEEKIFSSQKENVSKMLDFISGFAAKYGFEKSFMNNLMVVSDEMLSNVSKYAYGDGVGEIYIRALYNIEAKEFILTMIDKGIEFNPFTKDVHKIEGNVDEIKEGGLGILIVKSLMSEYAYDRINNKNIIILKKKF